jgi:hypothetical protein
VKGAREGLVERLLNREHSPFGDCDGGRLVLEPTPERREVRPEVVPLQWPATPSATDRFECAEQPRRSRWWNGRIGSTTVPEHNLSARMLALRERHAAKLEKRVQEAVRVEPTRSLVRTATAMIQMV